jgi:sterol desaturase/sphingolipid hydroxylase (fatty acid hydroxylase superfamily)
MMNISTQTVDISPTADGIPTRLSPAKRTTWPTTTPQASHERSPSIGVKRCTCALDAACVSTALHRAQHKWFWRLHAVHHSIEELSGINSYFHWTEPFFRIFFISLPAAYLVGIDGLESIFLIELMVKVQGYYLHTPTNLHLGPVLRRVIADNRFHRVHHSVEPRHLNTNFAAGTTLWDQLFGTAYFPEEDEWPEVGVLGEPSARTLSEYLWGPFQPLGGKASATAA